jgi:hypothetical protein
MMLPKSNKVQASFFAVPVMASVYALEPGLSVRIAHTEAEAPGVD